MGVYIKGMEMPKHDDEYVIFTVYGDGGVVYGPLNRPHVRYKNRAVPVPEPHGRLIDADKLKSYWEPDHSRYFDADYFIHTIDVAKAIIPASEEGE